MLNSEATRFLYASSRSYDGRITIKVSPNEAGNLECRLVVEKNDEDYLLESLNTHIGECRGIQLAYRISEDDGEHFAVVLTFSQEVGIAKMFRLAGRSIGRVYGHFRDAEFEFETDPDNLGPIRVRIRNNGTEDYHRFQLLVYAESVGMGAAQIKPTWAVEALQVLQESPYARDFEANIWYAEETNSATPGFHMLELDVEVLRASDDPLADMRQIIDMLPPQNQAMDEAG